MRNNDKYCTYRLAFTGTILLAGKAALPISETKHNPCKPSHAKHMPGRLLISQSLPTDEKLHLVLACSQVLSRHLKASCLRIQAETND